MGKNGVVALELDRIKGSYQAFLSLSLPPPPPPRLPVVQGRLPTHFPLQRPRPWNAAGGFFCRTGVGLRPTTLGAGLTFSHNPLITKGVLPRPCPAQSNSRNLLLSSPPQNLQQAPKDWIVNKSSVPRGTSFHWKSSGLACPPCASTRRFPPSTESPSHALQRLSCASSSVCYCWCCCPWLRFLSLQNLCGETSRISREKNKVWNQHTDIEEADFPQSSSNGLKRPNEISLCFYMNFVHELW